MLFAAKLLANSARLFVEPAIHSAHQDRDNLRLFLHHQYKLGRDFMLRRLRELLRVAPA